MTNPFRAQLFPNEPVAPKDMKYPLIVSHKLDGIRTIFIDGQMLARSLKPIANKQLQERFKDLKKITKGTDIILDGELYSHELTFQEIQHYVRTDDFTSDRSIKKHGCIEIVPEHLKFHCFDVLIATDERINDSYDTRLNYDLETLENINKDDSVVVVKTTVCNNESEVTKFFEEVLKDGYEGLILRAATSKYKYGRVTAKSGDGYKLKPYVTFDAKILKVIERTKVREGAEKTINELGRSVTSKKKADRIPCGIAAGFIVEYDGKELQVTLTGKEDFRTEIWNNKDDYVGKFIEYKGLKIGMKDVPRHAVYLRMRPDKDDVL